MGIWSIVGGLLPMLLQLLTKKSDAKEGVAVSQKALDGLPAGQQFTAEQLSQKGINIDAATFSKLDRDGMPGVSKEELSAANIDKKNGISWHEMASYLSSIR